MALRLRHAVGWTLAGNGLSTLTQWLILVVIGRLGGIAELGTLAFALALATPVAMLCSLSMRALYVADVCAGVSLGSFVILRTGLFATAGLLLGVVTLLWKGDPQFAALVILVMSSKLLVGLIDLMEAAMQKRERLDLANQILGLTSATSALAFIVSFVASRSLVGAAMAQVGALLVTLVLLWLVGLRTSRVFAWSLKPPAALMTDARAIVMSGLPLGLSNLGVSLITNAPRYVIEAHFGAAGLGLFAACAYLVTAGNQVILAVNQALLRRTAVAFQDGQIRHYVRLLGLGFLVGIGVGGVALAGALTAGETFLIEVYGDGFEAGQEMLCWVLAFGALSWITAPLRTALTIQRQLWTQPIINALTVVLVAAASVVLVREVGPVGAGIALTLGGAGRLVASGLLVLWSVRAPLAAVPAPAASLATEPART